MFHPVAITPMIGAVASSCACACGGFSGSGSGGGRGTVAAVPSAPSTTTLA